MLSRRRRGTLRSINIFFRLRLGPAGESQLIAAHPSAYPQRSFQFSTVKTKKTVVFSAAYGTGAIFAPKRPIPLQGEDAGNCHRPLLHPFQWSGGPSTIRPYSRRPSIPPAGPPALKGCLPGTETPRPEGGRRRRCRLRPAAVRASAAPPEPPAHPGPGRSPPPE